MSLGTDVVVINYRTPEDLQEFCQSLHGEPGIESVTIVNNAPRRIDEETAAHEAPALGARVINNEENLFYARAVNAAAVGLTAPILAIFNADVITSPGSIEAMADFLNFYNEVGVAGPRQVDQKGHITHGGIIGTTRRPVHRGWQKKDYGQYTDIILDAVTVSGSAYFVRRECWDALTECQTYQDSCVRLTGERALGAFLPTNHYYEETFCSVHASRHGWKNAYNGQVRMVHKWLGSCKDRDQLAEYTRQSRAMYREACADHGIQCE
jgi:hypothetical protein